MPIFRRILSIILFIAALPLGIFLFVTPGPWAILLIPFLIAYALALWDPKRFPFKKNLRAILRYLRKHYKIILAVILMGILLMLLLGSKTLVE